MKPTKSTKSPTKKPAVAKKKAPATKRTASVKAKPAVAAATQRQEITTETIAAHAYILWEKDGRPNGRDVEYWLQAESQLKQDTQSFAA